MSAQPQLQLPPAPRRPALAAVEGVERRHFRLHLLTYTAGNALFWALWGAIGVAADDWFLWPLVPLAGWSIVLGVHAWAVHDRPSDRPR